MRAPSALPSCVPSDERGIALPVALMVLAWLASVTLALLSMSAMEPSIAMNLKTGEQALALAEAGIERAIWALTNPAVAGVTDLSQVPAAYSHGELFTLAGAATGAYTVGIGRGAGPIALTARGYVLRPGVSVPARPSALTAADIAAQRGVELQVHGTVGGPASPSGVTLPGALTVAGSVGLSGNAVVDGGPASAPCPGKAGVTVRDKTTRADGTVATNAITVQGAGAVQGTPAQQALTAAQLAPHLFTDGQLAALKSLARAQGTYLRPTSTAPLRVDAVDGLVFVDTVDGQPLGRPADPGRAASVTLGSGTYRGWLVVMGNVRLDGDVTYHGLIYAHNDIAYRSTGGGGIAGAMVAANGIDATPTVVDGTAAAARVAFDCGAVGNGGGALGPRLQEALRAPLLLAGTWREVP